MEIPTPSSQASDLKSLPEADLPCPSASPSLPNTALYQAQQHKYQNLQHPRSIRLIRFQLSETLSVSLEEASLDNVPDYDVISYTWDGQQPDCPIDCNGWEILVTRNCKSILEDMEGRTGNPIWIDAVCIDQTSIPEKNVQVPLMKEIYEKAALCFAWLGNSTAATDKALRLYKTLANWDGQPPEVQKMELVNVFSNLREEANESCAKAGLKLGQVCPMYVWDPLMKTYFSRIWTLQEIALPERVILFGENEFIRLTEFMEAIGVLSEHVDTTSTILAEREQAIQAKLIGKQLSEFRCVLHPNQSYQNYPLKLQAANKSSILSMGTWLRYAFDARDQIYGLYGLLEWFGFDNLPIVDYSKSVEEVYTDITKRIIINDQSLDVIGDNVTGIRELPSLPSWVHDWNCKGGGRTSQSLPEGNFQSAPMPKHPFFKLEDHDHIVLRGKTVDSVIKVSEHTPEEALDIARFSFSASERLRRIKDHVNTFEEWAKMVASLEISQQYPTGEDVPTVYFKTLTFGADTSTYSFCTTIWGPDADTILMREAFLAWKSLLLVEENLGRPQSLDPLRDHLLQLPHLCAAFQRDFEMYLEIGWTFREIRIWFALRWPNLAMRISHPGWTSSERLNFPKLLEVVEPICHGRKLFFTQKGYMGLAISDIKEGDEVLLLEGLRLPMVSRREGDQYRLISPAYIHGIMHGEMWDQSSEEQEMYDIV